ncbi:hypothetical protein ACHHYP_16632 [Achlya hypogyna]|uniref:Uncharacterized protein n=1 Tax=Achlya hypogyna TaxID=1202772 RepID=A0A1V9Y688_ACHHY|nr:hypothetical protein ACHHYP_16632 [Achlya hypogyna]
MSGFRLQPHELLRDPTKDELYNGPERTKLPVAVQRMDAADTACTFCGVSYFVFAEVQELQQKVKCFQRQFEIVAQWLQAERAKQVACKAEMAAVQAEHAHTVATVSSALKGFTVFEQAHRRDLEGLRQRNSALVVQLAATEKEKLTQRELILDEANRRIAEAEDQVRAKGLELGRLQQQMLDALQEAASLHETSQAQWAAEKSVLATQLDAAKASLSAYKVKATAEHGRLEARIAAQEEEVHAATAAQAQLRTIIEGQERALADARSELEHKATTSTETFAAVQAELRRAQHEIQTLHDQLLQAQAVASRTLAEAEVERVDVNQLQDDIAKWKHQATALEKNKALLLAERTSLKQEVAAFDDRLREAKNQSKALQQSLDEQARLLSSRAAEAKAALDAVKLEWTKEVAQLKSNHIIAMDSATATAQEQIERLQLELQQLNDHVRHIKLATTIAEKKCDETERALREAKQRAAGYMEELQSAKMGHQQAKSSVSALERKLREAEQDQATLVAQRDSLQQDLETKQLALDKGMATSLQAKDATIDRLKTEILQYKKTVEQLEAAVREVPKLPPQPKTVSNQESVSSDLHELRSLLAQKEQEISLLQQTVHRECLERTSMLEKMRSAKILPDMAASTGDMGGHHPRHPETEDDPTPTTAPTGLASFYEKLRRNKKPKAKKGP